MVEKETTTIDKGDTVSKEILVYEMMAVVGFVWSFVCLF